ncbi:MAG: polyprenyl synthetase family protein [Ruminiclostridium sp.]|jgi:geranylgeranyl diphosphate synthase type II|nr:polyprenyl synthetase family protein [Ruminiclostridium sp.]
MDFEKQLKDDQAVVEVALEAFVRQFPGPEALGEAMGYSLLSGGKRIRPILVLEVCRLFGGASTQALPFACALEMIHTYSLIHDDLPCMDDDDLRRGRPTNHKVYGEAMAVLAGDGLLTAAFDIMSQGDLPARQMCRGVGCLARAAGPAGMVGGQVLDLAGEGRQLRAEEIDEIERMKTGALIEAAARLGAIAAGSTPEQEEAAASYARSLGRAFQIRDDILDVEGSEAELGKSVGSDQEREKSTLVALEGIPACEAKVQVLTREAVAQLQGYPGSEFLCTLAQRLALRTK